MVTKIELKWVGLLKCAEIRDLGCTLQQATLWWGELQDWEETVDSSGVMAYFHHPTGRTSRYLPQALFDNFRRANPDIKSRPWQNLKVTWPSDFPVVSVASAKPVWSVRRRVMLIVLASLLSTLVRQSLRMKPQSSMSSVARSIPRFRSM